MKNKNKNEQSSIDKNLRMMSLSAIVLIGLFVYTIIKSDNVIQGDGYYIGIGFLFILLILTFALQKYKDKIRAMVPRNKFQDELNSVSKKDTSKIKESQQETNSTIESSSSNITFKDVAGIKDVKAELEEVVDFLNNSKKYQKYGVSLPKGVLLVGPPGVGKTLIARAVAGEADVPFFFQSGGNVCRCWGIQGS